MLSGLSPNFRSFSQPSLSLPVHTPSFHILWSFSQPSLPLPVHTSPFHTSWSFSQPFLSLLVYTSSFHASWSFSQPFLSLLVYTSSFHTSWSCSRLFLCSFSVPVPVLCLLVFFSLFSLNFFSGTFTVYIYILNFRVTNGYYHHFCMHDTLSYHHHLPVETKGSGSSVQPPSCSTGNEGVICHKSDHIKSPRHENFLSWQFSPVTSCRTIRPTRWAYLRNT